ncbi:hypothetical protein MDA_GLEAN10018429 [Myotis davidii]|uniref:Uncharacterized protein n=1 Tax=Myotis davidii TaxID=225400 RepID=L5M4P6_MYODS|nr:hypothetical protein MDA_GLEAN10018429 [Myotis davidii]
MAGVSHGGVVEQVSGGARPRRGAGHCHWGEPLVVTENSLLQCAMVLPSTCACCWRWPHSYPLLVLKPQLASAVGALHRSRSLGAINGCERRLPALTAPESFFTCLCS